LRFNAFLSSLGSFVLRRLAPLDTNDMGCRCETLGVHAHTFITINKQGR